RVDLEGLRQLGPVPGLLAGLQGAPGHEGRGIALACACPDAPRDGRVNSDQFRASNFTPILGWALRSQPTAEPRTRRIALVSGPPGRTPWSFEQNNWRFITSSRG